MERELSYEDMEDLLTGAVLLGCGGGGDPTVARTMIDEVFQRKKKFILVTPQDLSPDAWIAILGHVGGGIDAAERELVRDLKPVWQRPISMASRELASYLAVPFQAYLPSEIGAGNVIAPMFVAALEGVSTLDADVAGGRAKPELIISTTHLHDLPVTPFAVTTQYGDSIIVKSTVSDHRAEQICRYLARVSNGRVAVARCPSPLSLVASALHQGSISKAIEIGRTLRTSGNNRLAALVEVLHGSERFDGRIAAFTREERDGFMWGTIALEGGGAFEGEAYKLWYKNENLMGWRNGELDIACPDAIVLVDAGTGEGIYLWGDHCRQGREVAVIGVPAIALWQSRRGISLFGPGHFGFECSYFDSAYSREQGRSNG